MKNVNSDRNHFKDHKKKIIEKKYTYKNVLKIRVLRNHNCFHKNTQSTDMKTLMMHKIKNKWISEIITQSIKRIKLNKEIICQIDLK